MKVSCALAIAMFSTFALAAPPAKPPSIPTTALTVVDANGKAVGRLAQDFNGGGPYMLTPINGVSTWISLGTRNVGSGIDLGSYVVAGDSGPVYFLSSDCTGQAYIYVVTPGARPSVVASSGGKKWLYLATTSLSQSAAVSSVFSNGTCFPYTSPQQLTYAFPVSAPIDLGALILEPLSLQ